MKLSHSALITVLATSAAVQAAPAAIKESQQSTQVVKREELELALAEFEALQALKVKRADLANELSEREYQIVTQVLTAIKDTELAPVVLKFFVSNETLKNLTITTLEYVIKSGLISLEALLDLAVQSGLVVSVLNDVLGNCQVYVSIIDLAKSIIGNLLGGLLSKRDGINRPYTLDEGMSMLRRDGLIRPSIFDQTSPAEKRDVDDIVVNLLESLASSGLATQVVETVLTDTSFISFGAQLVKELNSQGLISITKLVSAVSLSGLLPQLVKEFLNFSTLKEIAGTAIDALDGTCSSTSSGNLTLASTSSSSSSSSSGGLLSLLGGATGLLGSLLGGSSSSSSSSSSGSLLSSLFGSSGATTTATTKASTATVAAVSVDPCATAVIKRERLRMY